MSTQSTMQTPVDHSLLMPKFTTFIVLLTNRCNLSCKHCYVSSGPSGIYGLPKARVLHLVEEIYDIFGSIRFVLTGGEALSRREDCLEIIALASNRHRVQLLTNGTLLTKRVASNLVNHGIDIRVSIDGHNAQTHDYIRGPGTFDRAIAGIRTLQQVGYSPDQIELYATIVPENVSTVSPTLALAEELGVRRVVFAAIAKLGRAIEFWPHIPRNTPDIDTEGYRKYFSDEFDTRHGDLWNLSDLAPFELGFNTLNFYADGSVFPYTFTDELDRNAGYLGNINSDSLAEILSEKTMAQAVLFRFLAQAMGPERSLRTLLVSRRL